MELLVGLLVGFVAGWIIAWLMGRHEGEWPNVDCGKEKSAADLLGEILEAAQGTPQEPEVQSHVVFWALNDPASWTPPIAQPDACQKLWEAHGHASAGEWPAALAVLSAHP